MTPGQRWIPLLLENKFLNTPPNLAKSFLECTLDTDGQKDKNIKDIHGRIQFPLGIRWVKNTQSWTVIKRHVYLYMYFLAPKTPKSIKSKRRYKGT